MAHTVLRQELYERLKAAGALPKSDQEDLPYNCTCLVGATKPLSVEEHPELRYFSGMDMFH
jgi:hypothetical protein